jgi:hypothetical protein
MAYYTLELVIVYNLNKNSGKKKLFCKYFSPSKYPCHLTVITQNIFGLKRSWKKFLDSLPMDVRILYKDEFKKEFSESLSDIDEVEFPCVYIKKGDLLEPFISNKEIERTKSLDDLIDLFYKNLLNK